jgi:hypothetical protein
VRKHFTHGGKEMDREKKEKIAVFRFGVIFPLVEKDLHQYWGEKERILEGAGQQGMGNSRSQTGPTSARPPSWPG